MANASVSSNTSGDNTSSPPPPPQIDPTQNPNSPYFLHPGENPGFVLVSPPFNDDNYYTWSRAIKRALSSKNKIKFIDGTLPQPAATDSLHDPWLRCNHLVVSWITRTLSPHIIHSTISFDNARALWLDLQHRFTKGNHFRMSDLLQEIHSMRQGDKSLSAFFTDMKIIWDELGFLRPTPSCICTVTCSCPLNNSVQNYKDKEHTICFLKGLNDCYQSVRSQILIMHPLPSASEAYSMVVQQERPCLATPIMESTVFATNSTNFNSPNRGSNSSGRGRGCSNINRSQMLCSHCNRTNHTIDKCYFKHGFPPGYRNRN